MMSTNMEKICSYILTHKNENMTAQTIADATQLGIKGVNGAITCLQKLGATIREEALVRGISVKYIRVIDEKIIKRRMCE